MDADVFDRTLVLRAEEPSNHASIDGRSKKFSPLQNIHTSSWGLLSLLFNEHLRLFAQV
jgi:hypothetical protein